MDLPEAREKREGDWASAVSDSIQMYTYKVLKYKEFRKKGRPLNVLTSIMDIEIWIISTNRIFLQRGSW